MMRRMMGVVALLVVMGAGGCAGYVVRASFEGSKFRMMIAAETTPPGRQLTEDTVQKEIERLLALKPSSPVPAKVLLYEIPSTRESHIRSARKMLRLRKETGEAMKTALEKTGLFAQIDFLPELYLPDGIPGGLKALRLAAARAHADALLLYSTEAGYEREPNALAALYITVVGAFLVPGTDAAATAVSKAVLIDVRTGYIYRVFEAYGESTRVVPIASVDDEAMEFEARKQALTKLAQVAAEKVVQLGAVKP